MGAKRKQDQSMSDPSGMLSNSIHHLTFENASSRILKFATAWISEDKDLTVKENMTSVLKMQEIIEQRVSHVVRERPDSITSPLLTTV
jgi:hypothetical protein